MSNAFFEHDYGDTVNTYEISLMFVDPCIIV
jgi:hypothetical protein